MTPYKETVISDKPDVLHLALPIFTVNKAEMRFRLSKRTEVTSERAKVTEYAHTLVLLSPWTIFLFVWFILFISKVKRDILVRIYISLNFKYN